MGDEPPPLPPKMRNRYTEEDQAKALEEEKLAFDKIHKEKFERSQSQRLGKTNKHTLLTSHYRPQTLTENKSHFQDANYISKPAANRPVIKPRTISLINDGLIPVTSTVKVDGNSNIQSEKNEAADLMQFTSPERPSSKFNDDLQKLYRNKNQVALAHTQMNSLSKISICSSQSLPLAMNTLPNKSSGMPLNNMRFSWQPTKLTNGSLFMPYSSNSSQITNFKSQFSPQLPFSVQPNIPLRTYPSITPPPLPSRSPVMDMSRLTFGLSQGSGQASSVSVASPLSSACPSSFQASITESKMTNGTKKQGSKDLIDFGSGKESPKRSNIDNLFSSLLEDFDPLKAKYKESKDKIVTAVEASQDVPISDEAKELLKYKVVSREIKDDEQSYYEQDDPFQYMEKSRESVRSDPVTDIYDGLRSPGLIGSETFDIPPPLPPKTEQKEGSPDQLRNPKNRESVTKRKKRETTVYEGRTKGSQIQIVKTEALNVDKEVEAFWDRVRSLRSEYAYHDHIGNPGLLHSPSLDSSYVNSLSVKLAVHYENFDPALFTCNLNTTIEHVVMQSMVALELSGDCANYFLKVRGIDEYLCGDTQLGEYEYVHLCNKNEKDILFTLVNVDTPKKSYLRTAEDDDSVENTDAQHLLTVGSMDAIYYDSLVIAIEAFDAELDKLQQAGFQLLEGTPNHELSSPMISRLLRQVVKQVCALLGELETVEISRAISLLIDTCRTIQKSQGVLDGEDDVPGQVGLLSTGSHESSQPCEKLKVKLLDALSRLACALNNYLFMYMGAFRVDFTVDKTPEMSEVVEDISVVFDRIKVQICGLHRLDKDWQFDEFFVEAQIFHGSSCVGKPQYTSVNCVVVDPKFYPKVDFSQSLDMEARFNTLPRESRLVFTVFGVKKLVSENKEGSENKFIREELGWAAIQMFSFDGYLATGGCLLTLWPIASDKRLGPAPYSSDHPFAHACPILSVELPELGFAVHFPTVEPLPPNKPNFEDLDLNTQQQLLDIIERDIFTFNKSSIEEREILWEKRHYLHQAPDALAKVLLAAHSWDVPCLPDLHSLVLNWTPIPPADSLHLLLPSFPDTVVRNKAVEWIRGLGSDELIAYLPQLVQAVKHEAWDVSKLTELLLQRALTSPRLAHHLYWLLNQCLPQQTSMGGEREVLADARYTRRLNMVTRALMKICGKNLENRLLRQEALLRTLYETALAIKDSKDSQRLPILHHELQTIHENLKDSPTSLPLSPSLEVAGVDIEACSYYTSFTVPLRLAFVSSEPNTQSIHTIFKVGDDLRQDMLVIQMIRLMDKLWLKEELDLKIVTFNVVPTGDRIGILEMVPDAETLRKIQTENGLTGSFKERPIAEWLAKQNPSQLEYHRAVSNFTMSCAGYCVATYILGICDRHNDNIMLKTSGHLFHIDFGKFLGDAQKFGNVKRDRTPFVLTTDMAYVINGGEKPSDKFQAFVDLCCKAFNIIRQNAHLLLYLFALMASSGIPGMTSNAVHYVEKALLQDKTNAEAGAFFAKMIQESLTNWFTQVNFFIHNLAQLRFTGDATGSDSLLSFVPHTYTMAQDGRIRRVRMYSFQKRYNPYKYYVYILKVERKEQSEPSFLFRSYKEFSEFHQKLCCVFPLARIHSLPKGVQIGRSEVKAVAERRKFDIELFLSSLFGLADEIAHSDLVYTFLHPLLRDQEDTDIHITKLKKRDTRNSTAVVAGSNGSLRVQGQVKLNLQYIRGQLQVVVQHARNLAQAPGAPEPSPYVKLYLLPDPNKKTKRKTKVVKKSCHPTFMEMITYRMSLDIIRYKVLEVSVWSEDKFSENSYFGSAYLKLGTLDWKGETCEWLSLEHHIKTAREHVLPILS